MLPRNALAPSPSKVPESAQLRGELWGGARINHVFRSEYFDALENLDSCAELQDADIAHTIRQATGPRSPLFVPEVAFEILARRQIALMRPSVLHAVEQVLRTRPQAVDPHLTPARACVHGTRAALSPHCCGPAPLQVMIELLRLLPACLPQQATRYAALQARMQRCGEQALARREKETLRMVSSLIDIELAHLNTSHPDFVGGSQAMRLIAQQLGGPAEAESSYEHAAPPYHPPHPEPPREPSARGFSYVGGAAVDASSNPFEDGDPNRASGPLRASLPQPQGEQPSKFLQTFSSSGKSPSPSPLQASQPPPPPPPPPPAPTYAAFGQTAASAQRTESSGREKLETDIIRSLLVSYVQIVRRNLQDSVPKAIMHFLVNSIRGNIQNELVAELYRENEFEEMLREADDTVRRRLECKKVVSALEGALRVLEELRTMRSLAY